MSTAHDRTAADLTRAFADLGARATITSTDGGVIVPHDDARRLLSALSFHEGGSRQPFVYSLMQRPPASGVFLRGDEGRHLWRALGDIVRARRRNEQIDRGQIPGAMSGAEAMRLVRRHPVMFGRGR